MRVCVTWYYHPGVGGWGVTLIGALVFSCNLLYCVLIIETIIIVEKLITHNNYKITNNTKLKLKYLYTIVATVTHTHKVILTHRDTKGKP